MPDSTNSVPGTSIVEKQSNFISFKTQNQLFEVRDSTALVITFLNIGISKSRLAADASNRILISCKNEANRYPPGNRVKSNDHKRILNLRSNTIGIVKRKTSDIITKTRKFTNG